MAYLTTELKFILGLKQQKYCVGSLNLNNWIVSARPSGGYWWWSFVSQTHCLGKRLVACVGAYRPFLVLAFSTDQVSILGWDALQRLQDCGLSHCHLHDLPQLLAGGREAVLHSSGSTMENLPATNISFHLLSFEPFMKGLDWKRIETCTQK